MKTGRIFLVGTHRYSYRAGEPLEIIGVAFCTPDSRLESRPTFRVRDKDGNEDFVAIKDDQHVVASFYELISEADVNAGRIPKVIH